jgi:hypothetical protein
VRSSPSSLNNPSLTPIPLAQSQPHSNLRWHLLPALETQRLQYPLVNSSQPSAFQVYPGSPPPTPMVPWRVVPLPYHQRMRAPKASHIICSWYQRTVNQHPSQRQGSFQDGRGFNCGSTPIGKSLTAARMNATLTISTANFSRSSSR